jgi:hypothetical protein
MVDVRQGLSQRGPVREACDEAGTGRGSDGRASWGRRGGARGGSDWRAQAMGGEQGLEVTSRAVVGRVRGGCEGWVV